MTRRDGARGDDRVDGLERGVRGGLRRGKASRSGGWQHRHAAAGARVPAVVSAHGTPEVGDGQLEAGTVAFTASGVTKSYPGVQALAGVDLVGYAGEVLAICGANGAGKSTFARVLAGQERPTSGTITVTGHDGPITDPATAERAGVLLMHQEPLIIDDFTVGQNVWLFTLRGGRDVNPLGPPRASVVRP